MTATGSGPAISICGLEFAFGKRSVLNGIDLDIPRGIVTVTVCRT
jgi:ABC-type transporter Mla maintaining outer membrane lipid asymmetry ATPase subunit MlaF